MNNMPRVLRVIDAISRTSAGVAGVALIVMLLHVVADVGSRTFAHAPLPGTLAFITYWWMPAIVFLSLGATELSNGHIQVSLLIDKLTRRFGRVIRSYGDVVAAASIGIVLYFGVLGAIEVTVLQKAELGVINVPVWFPRIVMAVGLAVYFLQILASLWRRQLPIEADNAALSEEIQEVTQ